MKRSFDLLAKPYHSLERICFGRSLQKAREFCLPIANTCLNGLLIGDGDGRFSAELLKQNLKIKLTSIDISSQMLATAARRANEQAHRIRFLNQDALSSSYPISAYDFIALHFCLDCFTQSEVEQLLPKLVASLKPDGWMAYSDFATNTKVHSFVVKSLYVAFRLITGLKARSLPSVAFPCSLVPHDQLTLCNGLVFSKLLQKTKTTGEDQETNRVCYSA